MSVHLLFVARCALAALGALIELPLCRHVFGGLGLGLQASQDFITWPEHLERPIEVGDFVKSAHSRHCPNGSPAAAPNGDVGSHCDHRFTPNFSNLRW